MNSIIEIATVLALGLIPAPFIGYFLSKLYKDDAPVWSKIERFCYRLCDVSTVGKQNWKAYAKDVLSFSLVCWLGVFVLLMLQKFLPFNPSDLPAPSWHRAFNIASAFITNTDWQNYSGEITLSYTSQVIALGVQLFASCAVGLSVTAAVLRGLAGSHVYAIGCFYRDLIRTVLYVLLPASIIIALLFISQGVIQNFHAPVIVQTLEQTEQILPQGPVASFSAIELLGSNGGGFFGQSAMHPYANPTYLANILSLAVMLLVPGSIAFCFGTMVGDRRQGVLLFSIMLLLLFLCIAATTLIETRSFPLLSASGTLPNSHLWEGKELRFGLTPSALWSSITTATSNGSANLVLQSMQPLAQLAALLPMLIGGVVFGGCGIGFLSILLMALLTVFMSGLMIGRSPHYLGRKIELRDMKLMVTLLILHPALILTGASIAFLFAPDAVPNAPSGFTALIYGFSSAASNNGSALAMFNGDTSFMNVLLGIIMLLGRFLPILLFLALAGSWLEKKHSAHNDGDLPTHTPLFGSLLFFVILIVGGLTFLPVIVLGPALDHLQMAVMP